MPTRPRRGRWLLVALLATATPGCDRRVTREEPTPAPSHSTAARALLPPPPSALPRPVQYDFGPHGERDRDTVLRERIQNPPHRGWKPPTCDAAPAPTTPAACERGATGFPAAQIEDEPERFIGRRVSVYGVLRKSWMNLCGGSCEQNLGIGDVTRDTYAKIPLITPAEGGSSLFVCQGDALLTCCSHGGVGRTVLATGVVERQDDTHVRLDQVSVCLYQPP